MKKTLVLVLVVSFVLSLASTALAFPVDFTGDFRLQARSIDDGIPMSQFKGSWFQLRGRLNFDGKVDDSTTFFGRISTRNNFGGANTSATEFDHYGVKIAASNWKFSVGRQAVSLGQGTIISTGYDASGVDNKFDGLVASTKAGNFDLNFIAGKTNAVASDWMSWAYSPMEYYGFDATTKLNDKFSAGVAYARSHAVDPSSGAFNYFWNTAALNATFKPSDNFSLNAEYAKSNHDTNNAAYFFAGTYSWDKDSFTVQYNKVDWNAVSPWNSGIGAVAYPFNGAGLHWGHYTPTGFISSYKGFTYAYNHSISKAASFHIIYMDLKCLEPGFTGSDKELGAGVVWKF